MSGKAICITGAVQGVGFRPAVWRLAYACQLRGSVWNESAGVQIQVWGSEENISRFIGELSRQAPPLSRIERIDIEPIDSPGPDRGFQITASRHDTAGRTGIAADAATCPDCLRDFLEPSNRRYFYPFTNCTHCGPRFSIIQAVPYDRIRTSMNSFALCSRCQAEYDDPADRRFHAQANACPHCGPTLWLENNHTEKLPVPDVLKAASDLLKQGRIIAVKGLGGFHLACAADNEDAVARLRRRKHRYGKSFAVMAKDLAMVRRYAEVSALEQAVLEDKAAPIVLLKAQGEKLAASVAPDGHTLGFMLPYTPLHHGLLQIFDGPLVLTSGNRSEEPQCTDNDKAHQGLHDIADYFLLHDRAIIRRLDDSVIRISEAQPRLLRRARGFAPEPFTLPAGFEKTRPILAMGGELKNSFCLLDDGQAILSHYIGDLENHATQTEYRQQIEQYGQLFNIAPEIIAIDLHPDYASTRLGLQRARSGGLRIAEVQHHHAHIAACMAEHGLPLGTEVLGVAFDGLGMGLNRELWGGEFLRADYRRFTRLAHLPAVPLPGGVQAIREPWRNTYAQLNHYFDWADLQQSFAGVEILHFLAGKPRQILDAMIARQLNSPASSSAGRFLDACAAAVGLCKEQISYEGQAAVQLENLAAPVFAEQREQAYPSDLTRCGASTIIDWHRFWIALLTDLQRRTDVSVIAARIHHGLARITAGLALRLCRQNRLDIVVLNGGVFQNRLLLEEIGRLIRKHGKTVLSPSKVPANDGGLAFGQAIVAAAQEI
jgi:hydrogenase maturation protein HypF